jgi:hypothetical protein
MSSFFFPEYSAITSVLKSFLVRMIEKCSSADFVYCDKRCRYSKKSSGGENKVNRNKFCM